MMEITHFILVPDSAVARRLRRLLAEQKTQIGVVVGTWSALLEYVSHIYLVPPISESWDEIFKITLDNLEGFWSGSFKVAPEDTAKLVKQALINVITALPVSVKPEMGDIDLNKLDSRPKKHFEDLLSLFQKMNFELPSEISSIRRLLSTDSASAIGSVCVYYDQSLNTLNCWQESLIEKLNKDANDQSRPEIEMLVSKLSLYPALSSHSTALYALQKQLFSTDVSRVDIDHSVQWIGVRDFMEEADVAAGMVQEILASDESIRPAEIGLLLPDKFEYSLAIEQTFNLAGLNVAGNPSNRWRRDLGREALFHFICCQQKPAPAMALSACLSSPLMPWSREHGAIYAQKIMDGEYQLKALSDATGADRKMLKLIREGTETSDFLSSAIKNFISLLNSSDCFIEHIASVIKIASEICSLLSNSDVINWKAIRRMTIPKYHSSVDSSDFNQQGVTIWRESQEPWRPVRFLLVLGFSQGNYPKPMSSSSVFSLDDLESVREKLNMLVNTPAIELTNRRQRFKRQLSQVSDFVTFIIPRRNINGDLTMPSDSMVFIEQIIDADEMMILEMDVQADRKHIKYLAETTPCKSVDIRSIESDDLEFNSNLLELRKDSDGELKPESPSSLQELMISPLAWLLNRVNAKQLSWSPEEPGPALFGTLAHDVFEQLFCQDKELPETKDIPNLVIKSLDQAILRKAPFLRGAQWNIERASLASGTIKAVQEWNNIIRTLNAKILGSEEWLKGDFSNTFIHGQVDSIIELPDGTILIVDYKRQGSNKRRPSMQKYYDSQASLYRLMLKTGGFKDEDKIELTNSIKKATGIGVVYYMLLDETALSDMPLFDNKPHHWDFVGSDVSSKAMQEISVQLMQIKKGEIKMNRMQDAQFYERDAGIKPYTLTNSPLISLFTCVDDSEVME